MIILVQMLIVNKEVKQEKSVKDSRTRAIPKQKTDRNGKGRTSVRFSYPCPRAWKFARLGADFLPDTKGLPCYTPISACPKSVSRIILYPNNNAKKIVKSQKAASLLSSPSAFLNVFVSSLNAIVIAENALLFDFL